MATQVTADKATVADNAAQVAADRKAAETAAQTAQAVADSLPDDYTTAVKKIAENTAEISAVKLTDKELQRRVNALYDLGNGITHKFETDTDTAYAKTVPTGAKLMSIKSVGGRSIVFNQVVNPNNFRPNYTVNGVTFTKLDNYKFVANGTATGGDAYFSDSFVPIKGHVYLEKSCPKGGSAETYRSYITGSGVVMDTNYGSGVIAPLNVDARVYIVPLMVKSGATVNNLVIYPQIYDLTAMFGAGNEPSTVEEFEKMFPADYYPYNAGEIVSAGTEEIVEQGKNLWNIDGYTASDLVDLGRGYCGIKLGVSPNSAYCISVARDTALCETYGKVTGADKRDIEFFGHKTVSSINAYTGHPIKIQTADENYVYVVINSFNGFDKWKSDFLKYFPNFQIEKSSTATAYAPFHRNTYQIPEAIRNLPGYGWSAGTARNYVDYENKRYVQCVQSVDLGTLEWLLDGNNWWYNTKIPKGLSDSNAICNKRTYVLKGDTGNETQWCHSGGGYFEVYVTDVTTSADVSKKLSGVILYYELATPIVTDISSLIPDDFLRNIEVEAGGSVTFQNSNGDSYRIPVPSEEEYIVKLSEVGGSV